MSKIPGTNYSNVVDDIVYNKKPQPKTTTKTPSLLLVLLFVVVLGYFLGK